MDNLIAEKTATVDIPIYEIKHIETDIIKRVAEKLKCDLIHQITGELCEKAEP